MFSIPAERLDSASRTEGRYRATHDLPVSPFRTPSRVESKSLHMLSLGLKKGLAESTGVRSTLWHGCCPRRRSGSS